MKIKLLDRMEDSKFKWRSKFPICEDVNNTLMNNRYCNANYRYRTAHVCFVRFCQSRYDQWCGISCKLKFINMTLALAEKASVIQKICPLPSELSFITKNIPCPEEGCNGTFLNSSNLEMHLSKHHKKRSDGNNKRDSSNKMNCQYHCPVEKCLYNINSDRYFSHIKYLKQHYLKVHAEKKFLCKKCDKGFSTEAARNVHMRICGMKFTCSCGCTYLSYEALITHAKRKNHTFDANLKLYSKGQAAPKVIPLANNETGGINCTSTGGNSLTLIGDSKKSPYILLNTPRQGLAGLPINVKPLGTILPAISPSPLPSGIDIGVQTERGFGCNSRRTSGGNSGGRRLSAQTQTWSVKRSKICAGTQTQGDYILKRAMRAAQIPISNNEDVHVKSTLTDSGKLPGPGGRKRKKSMETQTVVVSAEESTLLKSQNMSSESVSRQQRRLIEGVFTAEQSGECMNSVDHGVDFVHLQTQNSYQVPVIDPWIDVYPKCNSGTQTSPLSVKTVSHPVVTQTDLTGILLQDNLSNCQNQDIQCFCPLPDIKDTPPIVSGNMAVDSHASIPDFADVTTNIDAHDFTGSDFTTTSFDPMFASDKLTPVENVNPQSGTYSTEEDVSFRDSEVDLVNSIATACSTETQTEGESNASDPTLSHIETQTNTEDFLPCCFEQLLHANMCTQTCEEMLFPDLGFSDIQTQTQEEIRFWQSTDPPIDDTAANSLAFLVSTETQTAISGRCPVAATEGGEEVPNNLWMSETSHMETQTDIDELRKLIAELTKHDIEGD